MPQTQTPQHIDQVGLVQYLQRQSGQEWGALTGLHHQVIGTRTSSQPGGKSSIGHPDPHESPPPLLIRAAICAAICRRRQP